MREIRLELTSIHSPPQLASIPWQLLRGGVRDGLKHGGNVVAAHGDPVASTADEAQLHPSGWVEGGEHLLMALSIDHYIGETWNSSCVECITSETCIEYFNGDVLNA